MEVEVEWKLITYNFVVVVDNSIFHFEAEAESSVNCERFMDRKISKLKEQTNTIHYIYYIGRFIL